MLTLGLNSFSTFGLSKPEAPAAMVSLPKVACVELLENLKSIIQRGNKLFDWVDSERESARRLGIESILIELLALVEGVRLRYLYDALRDAVESHSGCELTEEGTSTLHRAERLIAEAERRLTGSPSSGLMSLSGQAHSLSQESSSPSNTLMIVAIILTGTVALAAIGLAFYLARPK